MKKKFSDGRQGVLVLALITLFPAVHVISAATEPGTRILNNHLPRPIAGLHPLSRVAAEQPLELTIGLPLRNPAELNAQLQRIYDPASPDYRKYLTPEEFTQKFGPTESEYQSVIGFVLSRNLTVTSTHANRMLLEVHGSVADIERAFQMRLNWYAHPQTGRRFYAPDTDPVVQENLPILDIGGLDNYVLPRPMSLHPKPRGQSAKPNAGSGASGSYLGNDFRTAYAPGVALTGAGQTVALLEFDGFYSSDITAYENLAGLRSVPVQTVLLNRSKGTAGANNDEVALDIEVAIAMAPGLSKVMVYEGSIPNTILSQIAEDNIAKQVSSSWTYTINGTTEQLFQQLAVQGQSLFQASGDNGAYTEVVDTPCDDPYLTSVGGTTLSTSGPGGGWVSEKVWNWYNTGIGTSGTGGGISTAYGLPIWQQGISMAANQGSTTRRNLPDVAMTADDILVTYDNGSTGIFGGTSAAAPLWAGFMALVNQQVVAAGNPPIGFLNPSLYALAKSSAYGFAFHDITTGNNTNTTSAAKFSAAAGYDLCTGWGTPAGQNLINALSGKPISNAAPVEAHMTIGGNHMTMNWTGGNPPYQVQVATDLQLKNWATRKQHHQ